MTSSGSDLEDFKALDQALNADRLEFCIDRKLMNKSTRSRG